MTITKQIKAVTVTATNGKLSFTIPESMHSKGLVRFKDTNKETLNALALESIEGKESIITAVNTLKSNIESIESEMSTNLTDEEIKAYTTTLNKVCTHKALDSIIEEIQSIRLDEEIHVNNMWSNEMHGY